MRSGNVRREEVTLEDTLRGLEEGSSLVERAKSVLDEIGRIQSGVFGGEASAGRLDREFSFPIRVNRRSGKRDQADR